MTANPNFRLTVDHLVVARERGMLVKGRIEGGVVHVGDAIQVNGDRPGPTVEVGQISVGSQVVKQASPGEEVVLLLVGLSAADIHPGERLISGRADEVLRPPEEESWPKLPERILPLRRLRDISGVLAALAFESLSSVFPIFIISGVVSSPPTELSGWIITALFLLGWYGLLGWITIGSVKNIRKKLYGRRVFRTGQATSEARILRRRVEVVEGQYSDSFYYELQVEFDPLQAQLSIGTQQYQLDTNEKLYNRLAGVEAVRVTYATRDPRVFVIAGE